VTGGPVNPPAARTALVTGANRGLGRALALGLAADGVAVGLLGRRREALDDVAREITGRGGTAAVAVADVRSWEATLAAVREVEAALGGVDLLVNNAGAIEASEVPVWEADPGEWWDVVEVDLRGPFHCVRAVVPGMVGRGGGRVVDLNSGAGAKDRENYSAYCAAKAGLFRLGGNLHLAGFARGLRAFELSPGVVRSDMTASMAMHADRTEWTPPEAVVGLAVAIARGELDAWSGCFLRAGADTPESLAAVAAGLAVDGSVPDPARRLVVSPYGDDDPNSISPYVTRRPSE
jgi:3-oxoacyl-[acyl-carrier protein] reductase